MKRPSTRRLVLALAVTGSGALAAAAWWPEAPPMSPASWVRVEDAPIRGAGDSPDSVRDGVAPQAAPPLRSAAVPAEGAAARDALLPAVEIPWVDPCDALVRELGDDDVRWNALHAAAALRDLGAAAEPALTRALASSDRQRRRMAAHLLAERDAAPRPALFAVLAEALEHDALPWGEASPRSYSPGFENAWEATRYLVLHAEAAAPWLVPSLDATDVQRRLLAA